MKNYWFYGYLLGYLSIQVHEALHWLVALFLGVQGAVGGYGLSLDPSVEPWVFIAVAAAGPFSTLAYAIAGLALYRSDTLFVKRLGFVLVFINAVGRFLYEFSSAFTGGAPDEVGMAYHLGVPDILLRVPVTLLGILTLVYILKDTATGLKTLRHMAVLLVSLVVAGGQVLLLGSLVNSQQALGRGFFQPVLLGYTPFLALVNLLFVLILYLTVRRDTRLSRSHRTG